MVTTLEVDQMIGAKGKWMIWAAMAIAVAAFHFWSRKGFSEDYGFPVNLYYVGLGTSHFLAALFIFVNFNRIWSFLFLGLTINNLVDEIFFSPTKFGLNEYMFTFFLLYFAINKYYGWKKLIRGFWNKFR